jgi:hypothetical protein
MRDCFQIVGEAFWVQEHLIKLAMDVDIKVVCAETRQCRTRIDPVVGKVGDELSADLIVKTHVAVVVVDCGRQVERNLKRKWEYKLAGLQDGPAFLHELGRVILPQNPLLLVH